MHHHYLQWKESLRTDTTNIGDNKNTTELGIFVIGVTFIAFFYKAVPTPLPRQSFFDGDIPFNLIGIVIVTKRWGDLPPLSDDGRRRSIADTSIDLVIYFRVVCRRSWSISSSDCDGLAAFLLSPHQNTVNAFEYRRSRKYFSRRSHTQRTKQRESRVRNANSGHYPALF